MDADGGDLVPVHVHSGLALDALSLDVELGETVDDRLFQLRE